MPTVKIELSTAAAHTIVAAPTGNQFIRVKGWVLMALTAVSVQFKDGSDNIKFGPLYFGATGGAVAPVVPAGSGGWFDLPVASALKLELLSAVAVGGGVVYEIMGTP